MTESYVACKRCGSPVRISNSQELRLIRCHSCGREFVPPPKSSAPDFIRNDTPAPGGPLEVRKISFFCAQTGDEFLVAFARNGSSEKFRIRSINIAPSIADTLPVLSDVPRTKPPKIMPFSAEEFDIAGWRCPCCSHGTTVVGSLFVKCGKCSHLVCGGKIIKIANGPETFQCTPDCGGGGVLSGQIDQFQGQGTIPDHPASRAPAIPDAKKER
jgi:DNA-directed RNA polymerase subunit RPC12/RpoP